MSEQAQRLAERFLEVHTSVVTTLTNCTDDQWRLIPPGEDRPMGVLFHHIVAGYTGEMELIRTVLNDQPVPYMYDSFAALDRWNEEYAVQHQDCSKAETSEALEQVGAQVVQFIRELSKDQLSKSINHPLWVDESGTPLTVEWFVELLANHPRHHLREIQDVVGQA